MLNRAMSPSFLRAVRGLFTCALALAPSITVCRHRIAASHRLQVEAALDPWGLDVLWEFVSPTKPAREPSAAPRHRPAPPAPPSLPKAMPQVVTQQRATAAA